MIHLFPTEAQLSKQPKVNILHGNKTKVDYGKLEAFYAHLIDNPIRPNIQDFFLLEDKIDVQEKFDKYDEQQKLMRQTQNTDFFANDDQSTHTHQKSYKKSIIFRHEPDNLNKSHSKILEKASTSKISYFEINSSLKNGLSHKSLNKKSFQTKKQEKETIQKLRQFMYEDEAIFFSIKGHVELQKKIHELYNNKKDKLHDSRELVDAILEKTVTNDLEKNQQIVMAAISHLTEGSEGNNSFQQSQGISEEQAKIIEKKPKNLWKKHQQIKEHSFFSLINFKSLRHSQDLQYYKFVPKSECLIAKILISQNFNSSYLKKQEEKLKILSQILINSNKAENNKSQTFKQLFDAFEEDSFKREMAITFQGKHNQRIYILSSQGDVELTKRVFFKENQNVQGNKNIKISTLKGPILVNAQIFLDSSKVVNNLFKSNSFHKKHFHQETLNIDSETEEIQTHCQNPHDSHKNLQNNKEVGSFNQEKQVEDLQKKLLVHKKKASHFKRSSLYNGDKIFFGKDEKSYFEFYSPECNISSFTIKATSAYVAVYSISLQKFIQLTPERMKKKISVVFEEFYVTCLRKSMQRLQLFQKQIQVSGQKKNFELKQYAALASIQKLNRYSPQLKNQQDLDVSPAKVQFQNRKEFRGLKRNELVYRQGQILEKKIQMIKNRRKDNQANDAKAQNFKKKIENLIVQNLKHINILNTEKLDDQQKNLPVNQINKFYTENLTKIFNSEKTNPSDKYHILLDQKPAYQSTLKLEKAPQKKQHIIQKQMYVDPDCFDPKKNKSVKISFLKKGHPCVNQNKNYLKGMTIDEYTGSIKSNVSVKINETNKIKEQFLKIQSKCQSCKCYQDLDSYRNLSSYNSERSRPCTEHHRNSSHDVKYHTMKIGVNWKTKYSSLGKIQSKTAYNQKGMHQKLSEMAQDDEPFEKVYNRIKVLKQKSLEKFNFNEHLLKKGQNMKTTRSRKKSAPLLL